MAIEDGKRVCDRCGGPAKPQICSGDGRVHHHGAVHTTDNGLQDLCDNCKQTDDDEWTASRLLHDIESTSQKG